MLKLLEYTNIAVWVIMTIAYAYQIVYAVIGLTTKPKKKKYEAKELHKFAAVICARNEQNVIGDLVSSLKQQNYPKELFDVYVLADNCTDNTAAVARKAGAICYERFNRIEVGKGYALDYFFKLIGADKDNSGYDGYIIFDADNIVDKNFVMEMNKVYDKGYKVSTCYRNSKNFGEGWIATSYGIWFLRESRFLNASRMKLGTTCHVGGTGFMIADEVVKQNGGWPFNLLTEDIQFSADCTAKGIKIGYCDKAVIYDEQPTTLKQSWNQRMRWSKGFYQVDKGYCAKLFRGIFKNKKGKFGCYDILMTIAPGMLFTVLVALFNLLILAGCLTQPAHVMDKVVSATLGYLGRAAVNFYIGLVIYAVLTVITEWKNIKASWYKKLMYIPMFPLFMATYIPIAVCSLVQKVEWKPIQHYSSNKNNKTTSI